MSTRRRAISFAIIVVAVVITATAYTLVERHRYETKRERPPTVQEVPAKALSTGPRVVFRHTGPDSKYGLVSVVGLDDPGGPRGFTDAACDRVAAWSDGASCLVTHRGVVTAFRAEELGADWSPEQSHPLPGIPSRTRVSPSGTLVATTSFVTGHSYMSVGFSTTTVIRELGDGKTWGDLEKFTLVIEGRSVKPDDRNVWGVTFVDDDRFYATVSTAGKEWLVEGDLSQRTLTSVVMGAECPSISPDGTRVAYKIDVEPGDEKVWGLAVLDLGTLERTDLTAGPRGVDDQVEWLDDDTLLYGLPNDTPGDSDVWALDADGASGPELFLVHAWSPSIVREE